MQYFDAILKLFSFFTQAIKLFQKKYYVGEFLNTQDVQFDYYPDSLEDEKMFAFKVSPIPMESRRTLRKTLSFTLINKTDKPVKVTTVQLEGRKKKLLPLDPLVGELPKVLEPFIGEFTVSVIIDQLWAYAVYTDERFAQHTFSSLFFFDNLKVDLENIVFTFNEGSSIRHKISKSLLTEKVFNPLPKIHKFPLSETKCSVDECANKADYIVFLYDQYNDSSTFFEQDFTCPFLCEVHLQENERGIGNAGVGERRFPRSHYHYPHSNRHDAQGYTKYAPLERITLLSEGHT